jgi:hypothetical protein
LRAFAILDRESWAQVFAPVTLNSGKTYPYGFGWSVDELDGQMRHHHGGSWQGFRSYISRYLGSDTTIIVLANLAETELDPIVDGIARILDPKLAQPADTPIADSEPEVTARLGALLEATRLGKLSRDDFGHIRAGFFPGVARYYQELLRPLGAAQSIELLERRELGDDRVYRYAVAYEERELVVRFALAPDDKVSVFSLRSR